MEEHVLSCRILHDPIQVCTQKWGGVRLCSMSAQIDPISVWESTYEMDVELDPWVKSNLCERVCLYGFFIRYLWYLIMLRCWLFYVGMPYSMWRVLPHTWSCASAFFLKEALKDLWWLLLASSHQRLAISANHSLLASGFPTIVPWPMPLAPTNEAISCDLLRKKNQCILGKKVATSWASHWWCEDSITIAKA